MGETIESIGYLGVVFVVLGAVVLSLAVVLKASNSATRLNFS